jgi:hypothetical protein
LETHFQCKITDTIQIKSFITSYVKGLNQEQPPIEIQVASLPSVPEVDPEISTLIDDPPVTDAVEPNPFKAAKRGRKPKNPKPKEVKKPKVEPPKEPTETFYKV